MSGQDEEYQRRAAEAQKWADRAGDDLTKAAWLRVVEGWLSMISRPHRTAEQQFADTVRIKRNGGGETETPN